MTGLRLIHNLTFYPKDFIQTADGLVFAVVAGMEDNNILSFLRYRQTATGWQKLDTVQANTFLTQHAPVYHYYSTLRDTACHAVPLTRITHHFQPQLRLQQLLLKSTDDSVLHDCICLIHLLQQNGINIHSVGVTGSLLIGAQQSGSDIDLVFYDRHNFNLARRIVQALIVQKQLQDLTDADWLASYQRRNCELDFADYVWHERRKGNKALFNGRKIDFSLVTFNAPTESMHFKKAGAVTRTLKVLDDAMAYHYPAEYRVDAPDIEQVVCFTATYTGQAVAGEWIEVAGQLEVAENGLQRIVVGASREAPGEYIKVVPQYA
ncbi:MAG: hypothetical protein ABL903_11915 [Methylococcales bacterium]